MKKNNDPKPSWVERLANALLPEPKDREQLISILHDAKERKLLDGDALEMIEGVLKVSEMQVRDVMVPRPQMIIINEQATPEEALPIITESGHSRFPVTADTRDEIIGILLAKDLLKCINQGNTSLKSLIRKPTFIPESKRLDVLLKEFRLKRYHIAIIVDEYGGVAGLVTIEDLLEQIVGDIEDEFDTSIDEPNIQLISETSYRVQALTPIDELNDFFDTCHPDEDFDTLGGLILHHLSHLPKEGENIIIGHLKFTVIKTESRSIQELQIDILPEDQ